VNIYAHQTLYFTVSRYRYPASIADSWFWFILTSVADIWLPLMLLIPQYMLRLCSMQHVHYFDDTDVTTIIHNHDRKRHYIIRMTSV